MPTNYDISLDDASALTENYRDQFAPETTYIKGEMFDNSAIQSILDQYGCESFRIYYGLDSDNVPCLILVGVDSSGNDLYNGVILEHGAVCPPYCSSNNPLNS